MKIAEAADEGLNPDGSMIYENFVSKGKIDRELHWWVQSENVVGHVNLYQHFGDEEALQIALQCWDFIQVKLVDRVHGEWHWSLYADGTVNTKMTKLDSGNVLIIMDVCVWRFWSVLPELF